MNVKMSVTLSAFLGIAILQQTACYGYRPSGGGSQPSQGMDLSGHYSQTYSAVVRESRDVAVAHYEPAYVHQFHAPPLNPAQPAPQPPQWVSNSNGHTSTFSVDVDTASYGIARRSIENGRLPQAEMIRVEEFINAVPADDSLPEQDRLALHTELVPHPGRTDRALLRMVIAGQDLAGDRPPLNLTFLMDTSGSMRDRDRLPMMRDALRSFIQRLGPQDQIAIVSYDRQAEVLVQPTTSMRGFGVQRAINRLKAGGNTNGSEGIRVAYEVARSQLERPGVHRVVLVTDGNFNAGRTDIRSLEQLIHTEAQSGIALTIFGVGSETDDARLEAVSNIGDGNYHYLANRYEADRVLGAMADGTLVTVATDVKAQLYFHPGAVRSWRLIGYDNRRLADHAFNRDGDDAGDIGAGERVTAFYELELSSAVPGGLDQNPFLDGAEQEPSSWHPGDPLVHVRVRHQPPGGGVSELIERDVCAVEPYASAAFRWSFSVATVAMRLRGDPWAVPRSYQSLLNDLWSAHRELGSDQRHQQFMEMVEQLSALSGEQCWGQQ